MSASRATFSPILKENYVGKRVSSQLPTDSTAITSKKSKKRSKMAKIGQMLHRRFKTFAQKVAYVKKNMPNITNPKAFVGAAIAAAGKE
jgi:type I site-specific restriction endonuclease